MEFPENGTYRETLGPAIHLALQGKKEEAQEWFNLLVQDLINRGDKEYTVEEATRIVRSNIGYFAGYYGESERRAVAEVYGAMHPIFGNDFSPTDSKALEAGKRAAHGEF